MTITSKKITKVNTTVSWKKALVTDDGVTFATMTATIDERRPLGTVTFSVLDQMLYEANVDNSRVEYENFQKEVIAVAQTTVVISQNVEEA